MRKRHIIIGSSAAGIGVLTKLRKLAQHDEIMCITAQKEMPYNTCLLADFLSEHRDISSLWTKQHTFFHERNISLVRDTRIVELDAKNQLLYSAAGNMYSYDTLFIGTGTTPLMPTVHHHTPTRLFRFHTLADTFALDKHLRGSHPKTALVVGAGLSGLECADALVERGLNVTILDGSTTLLPQLIDAQASHLIEQLLKQHAANFHPNSHVDHILVTRAGEACGVALTDGTQLHADIIVYTMGARPNIHFVKKAGIRIGAHGITTNKHLRTSLPHIYAGGDVAAVTNMLDSTLIRSCTWPDAIQQGMIAASNMAGQEKTYNGVTIVLSSQIFGTQFVSCGPVVTPPNYYEIIEHDGTNFHHRYLIHENKLKGFLLVGTLDRIGMLRRLVSSGQELSITEQAQLHTPK